MAQNTDVPKSTETFLIKDIQSQPKILQENVVNNSNTTSREILNEARYILTGNRAPLRPNVLSDLDKRIVKHSKKLW